MGRGNVKKHLKNKIAEQAADVTLSDCADNPRKLNYRKSRISFKSIGESVTQDPCDVNSDLDESLPESCEEYQEKPFTKLKDTQSANSSSVSYPSDVWFLIARYLSPEDICKFSLICKDAYGVVCSVRFWKHLYRRFNTGSIHDLHIPYDLKVCSDTKKGLRARVIRLAFLRMPTLAQALSNSLGEHADPYKLQGMRLVLAWHEKERNHWNYFFKWVGPTADLAKKHKNDLFENDEYGYRVLKVTCTDFICFPYPEHQYSYLSTIQLGLTSDMRHQKLTLGFSDFITTHRTSKVRTCLGQGNMVHNKIELSPVTKCVILDWWHPEYPYPRNAIRQIILPCSEEEW